MANYTRDELVEALRKADAANDTAAATAIARRIKALEAPDFSASTKGAVNTGQAERGGDSSRVPGWLRTAAAIAAAPVVPSMAVPALVGGRSVKNDVKGAAEGATNPLFNQVGAISSASGGPILGRFGDAALAYGKPWFKEQVEQMPGTGSTAGRIVGAGVTSLPSSLAVPGAGYRAAMGQGAAGAGMMSENLNDPWEVITNAGIGGTVGLATKFLGDKVVAPTVKFLGDRVVAPAFRRDGKLFVPKSGANMPSGARAGGINKPSASKLASISPRNLAKAQTNIDDAAALGLPYTLADANAGIRTRIAGPASRMAGDEAFSDAFEIMGQRQAGRYSRGMQAATRDFGRPVDLIAVKQGLLSSASRKAHPFYERAFAGDAGGMGGRAWSPKIQSIVESPTAQQGLKAGMRLQQMEALAAGETFDPTNYTITGFNDAGEPLMSKVPNLRTLDAIKRGWDDMLERAPFVNTETGRLTQQGHALNNLRKAFLREIDSINPDYSAARAAYAEAMKPVDALNLGIKAAQTTSPKPAAQVLREYTKLGPREQAIFRRAYITKEAERIGRSRNVGVNPFKEIRGGPDRIAQIEGMFPDTAPRFTRQAQLEGDMDRTFTEMFAQSATQPRAQADAAFAGTKTDMAADAALSMATGVPPMRIAGGLLSRAADRGKISLFGPQQMADDVLPVMTNTGGIEVSRRALQDVMKDIAERDAYRRVIGGLLIGPAAANAAISFKP